MDEIKKYIRGSLEWLRAHPDRATDKILDEMVEDFTSQVQSYTESRFVETIQKNFHHGYSSHIWP